MSQYLNSENGASMQLPDLNQPEMKGTAGVLQIASTQGTIRALELNVQSADSFSPHGLLSNAPALTNLLSNRNMVRLWWNARPCHQWLVYCSRLHE